MIPSLKDALKYRGCPICHILDEDEYDFMCHFQGQTIKEKEVLQNLVHSNGYCNFHFYEMARLTSPRVNATVAEVLIEKEIQEIEDGFSLDPERIDCPVCKFIRDREENYLQEFLTLLPDPSFQEEYGRTDGLCRIHLKALLHLASHDQIERFLILTQVRQLRSLQIELQDFIASSGSSASRKDRRGNSWSVAINKRVGKRGLKEIDRPSGRDPIPAWRREIEGP